MYIDESNIDEISALWQDKIGTCSAFMECAPVRSKNIVLAAETMIDFDSKKSVYILKQGELKEIYLDNVVVTYEVGDLVGISALINNCKTTVSTDFSVVVDEYDLSELMEFIRLNETRFSAWNAYLISLLQSFQLLLCHYKKQDVTFHPEVRLYEKGEVIIEEGSHDNEVFTLMSGSASVYVKEALVGDVRRDELFGAIAALTDTPRTATVKADSACSVLVVPSTSFKELLTSRPDTVAKLIEDMARTIISSNEKIVSLESAD